MSKAIRAVSCLSLIGNNSAKIVKIRTRSARFHGAGGVGQLVRADEDMRHLAHELYVTPIAVIEVRSDKDRSRGGFNLNRASILIRPFERPVKLSSNES